jgi:hypothetical protein
MTIVRTIAALTAALAFSAPAARAEVKTQWIEYSQGGARL